MHVASLNTAWFALIGLLWTGYFVLEGFDFGVGVLVPFLSRDDLDRRLCINTIGPTWDGNEVWLIVAAGATFAAFPSWYATLFSALYLPMFVILVALILRGVSFEFRARGSSPERPGRGGRPGAAWRAGWDRALFWGSVIPAVMWGVAFTDLLCGMRIGTGPTYQGGLLGLMRPVALLGGLTSLGVCALHGAVFLAAKTTGELARRARRAVGVLAPLVTLLVAGLVGWLAATVPGAPDGLPGAVPLSLGALAAASIAAGWLLSRHRHDGRAFAATALAIALLLAALFSALFPRVMVATLPARSLTIWSAAATHETLLVMTIVAAVFTPFVLGYQGWSYWVFRQRLIRPPQRPDGERHGEPTRRPDLPPASSGAELAAPTRGARP